MKKIEPIPCVTYTTFPYLIYALILIPFFFLVYFLSGFSFFRKLLLKHPKVFTCGYFSREGPKDFERNNTKFQFDMIGYGSSETKTMKLRVSISSFFLHQ